MELKLAYVEPNTDTAVKGVKFTRELPDGRRLDITTQPINPGYGDLPPEVKDAFESILFDVPTTLNENPPLSRALYALAKEPDSEEAKLKLLGWVGRKITTRCPELLEDGRTAYVCPVFSDEGVGFSRGYVVGTDEADTRIVAEFLAGGRVEIYLVLCESNGELLGGELLGDLSYADVVCDTDAYRRVIGGETFALAMETYLGIEDLEPQDPEYPGAELLETFTKLA